MRIVFPKANVLGLVTEVIENGFDLNCNEATFEFRHVQKRESGVLTSVQCRVVPTAPVSMIRTLLWPELLDFVEGQISYDIDMNAPSMIAQTCHLIFQFGAPEKRITLCWEINYDTLRMSFDNYMFVAVVRR
jgi:hypothetical protein